MCVCVKAVPVSRYQTHLQESLQEKGSNAWEIWRELEVN